MDLLVDEHGTFIAKHQGRLRVLKEKTKLTEVPLLHLNQVIVSGRGVGISSDAIRACSEAGIPIHFLSPSGTPYSSLYSAGLTGTVLTRRAQLRAYDTTLGATLARAFTRGKLQSQANLLRYVGKYRKEADPSTYAVLMLVATEVVDSLGAVDRLVGGTVDELRQPLLGIEGAFAARYWTVLATVVPEGLGWPGRLGRGAGDLFNQVLNYGYGVLYKQVEYALVLAGLDPYAGFLHADRPGKPSLVLDLIEEFRQAVVDRTLLGQVTRGWVPTQEEDGRLTAECRQRVATLVLERLQATEAYGGKRQPLRHILQLQARALATFLRGEREAYTPFVLGW